MEGVRWEKGGSEAGKRIVNLENEGSDVGKKKGDKLEEKRGGRRK